MRTQTNTVKGERKLADEALATYSNCVHYSALALQWKGYQLKFWHRLRYQVTNYSISCQQRLLSWVRSRLFPGTQISHLVRVCVPISAFPVTGGMRTVLSNIAQVTGDIWQIEYLTHSIGPHSERFVIHKFGTRRTGPWQFPAVWLYVLAGFWKLFSLLRHGARYDVILLQDGLYTAAFGALVAKLAGIRSVCIDHGNLSVLKSRAFRVERQKALAIKNWSSLRLLVAQLQYACYWPSLHLLARVSARLVDHYFIPGAAGDGVEEICKSIGVPPDRITRFANMIDVDKHIAFSAPQKAALRESYGIPANAIVIAIICRLAPEKGLEIALKAISQALTALSPTMRSRFRLVIAGDGPLRQQLEDDIHVRNLSQTCLLWGEASEEEIITILGLSEIFLFTSWRAAGYPLTVLEAMASACTVIATTDSPATWEMLGEGRGVLLPGGDVEGTAQAIIRLVSDLELCHSTGRLARDYVAVKHSANTFRRSLMRVTSCSALDKFLHSERESEL